MTLCPRQACWRNRKYVRFLNFASLCSLLRRRTTRAFSRRPGALQSRPTSWRTTPTTCRLLHSLHVTMDWMWEVGAYLNLVKTPEVFGKHRPNRTMLCSLFRWKARWHHSAAVHSCRIHRLVSLGDWRPLQVMDCLDSCWTGRKTDGRCFLHRAGSTQSLRTPPFKRNSFIIWTFTSEKGSIKRTTGLKHPLGQAAVLASLQCTHRIIPLAGISSYWARWRRGSCLTRISRLTLDRWFWQGGSRDSETETEGSQMVGVSAVLGLLGGKDPVSGVQKGTAQANGSIRAQ